MQRRSFLAVPLAGLPLAAAGAAAATATSGRIYATGDGVSLTPAGYAKLLAELTSKNDIQPDSYSLGGEVTELEKRFAARLGKETAVWLPTGTLANHLAVRILAGGKRRVLVQAESHLYNDCGDCATTLSGLNLVGLAPGKATFTLGDVERAANDAQLGRVPTRIGAIQIESPVRRRQGERFDFEEMRKISAWAKARGIGLHLDGARLFLESAYSKKSVKEYAALFDTVYVSLYKYFNSGNGAILAGPKALLADLFQTRRMFGGGLPHVWPMATVALHYVEGFEERYRAAVETSEKVMSILASDGHFKISRVPNGTNIFRLGVEDVNAPVYHGRLEEAGIIAQMPTGTDPLMLQVNETWGRVPAEEIARRFRKALG